LSLEKFPADFTIGSTKSLNSNDIKKSSKNQLYEPDKLKTALYILGVATSACAIASILLKKSGSSTTKIFGEYKPSINPPKAQNEAIKTLSNTKPTKNNAKQTPKSPTQEIIEKYKKIIKGDENIAQDEFENFLNEYINIVQKAPKVDPKSEIKMHETIFKKQNAIHNELIDKQNCTIINLDEINNQFEKLEPQIEDCVCFCAKKANPNPKHNIDFEIVKNAKESDTITPEKGFWNFYFNREDALDKKFKGLGKPENKMILEVHFPKGSKISASNYKNGTVIAQNNASYKVISKGVEPNGIMSVILEYILP